MGDNEEHYKEHLKMYDELKEKETDFLRKRNDIDHELQKTRFELARISKHILKLAGEDNPTPYW